ncbi:MAG: FG-GAP-like repeat-containing protein [Pyrinomonadaceae bacterium]|nr:FG-GAP-like repeat-containing protein [Pyrinomonadaceae bacterium]
MRKDRKYNHIWKIALVFIAVFAWVAIPFLTQDKVSAAGDVPPILIRTANLAAPSGSINPHGAAEYQLYSNGNRELEIEIEDVSLANGTVLGFFVDGNSVGTMAVDTQRAKLKLRTEDGQTVPTTNDGSTVEVRNGSTVLVAGVLGGGGPNPTPTASPSASPTASPTGSPTGTPTGTPSPSPTGSPTGSPSPSPTGSPNGESEIFASLRGTVNGAVANGYAAYEIHSSRRELEARIRQLNLPGGTVLTFIVDGVTVGQASVSGGEVRLRLRTDRGETVPVVTVGTPISVQSNGETILSGTFAGSTGPTPSPTGSPNPNPSPSPSPSPAAGRYFEAHATGAQVTPPVTTNATGEVKIFLNADETQATISGEFHFLSSAQTGAKIETTVGATPLIYDLGVVGGTNGHFATATIPVNAAQVAQLRSGLWVVTISSANNPNGEVAGTLIQHGNNSDFDGDGSNDLAVFRASTGTWYSQNTQGFSSLTFGTASDKLVSADFDGDGRTDAAVFRNVNNSGVWNIKRSSDGGVTVAQFGLATDIPVRGDFDGDGRKDLAVYRPSNGVWYVQNSNNTGYYIVQFGNSSDKPMPADMDGDGRDDVVVYRESTGDWYWLNSRTGSFSGVHFGQNGDIPVTGDFDGDGKNDVTVFRPSTGAWYTLRSSDGGFQAVAWGLSTDVPVAGNYDGDNKTDVAVFRQSTGYWYILRSSDGTLQSAAFGTNGDIPVVVQ